jgi:kynureninase
MAGGQAIATREDCLAADAADPLASCRDRFVLPQGVIYLDGNSLGPLPKSALDTFDATIRREWGDDLITSWNKAGWFDLPVTLGDRVGALFGAGPGQTVVCDTTSVNLYKAVRAAMGLRPDRPVIVSEAGGFPTDLYILEGAIGDSVGHSRRLIGRDGESLDDLLDESVAAVVLSNVDYKSGALIDMAAATEKIHAAGALAIWDLCHSAGVVPMQFDDWRIDFAVGCTYKYLNAGPGAPAYISVAKRHHPAARQPLSGWWGHADPFAFDQDFTPDAGIKRFLCGTQPVISMRGVECGLDAMRGADIAGIRAKSQALTTLFMARIEPLCAEHGMTIVTPRDPEKRGSHVAITFEHGYALVQAMIARGVIGDFRAPDIMRFGFAPLYLHYQDVWDAAGVMAECLAGEVWQDPRYTRRAAVT